MLVHRRVTPSIKFDGTHLYTWVERGALRVKCPRPGLQPGPLDPESSALTMRPPRLPQKGYTDINLPPLMSNKDKNISGSLVLGLRKWWRHVQAKNWWTYRQWWKSKTNPIQNLSAKPIPCLRPKWLKHHHIILGHTYLYSPYKGLFPGRHCTKLAIS